MNWDSIIEVVGLIVLVCAGGVGGWMISAGYKRWELLKAKATIRRAHRLADRWEREAYPTQATTTRGHVWEQLRYELTLGDDDWWDTQVWEKS